MVSGIRRALQLRDTSAERIRSVAGLALSLGALLAELKLTHEFVHSVISINNNICFNAEIDQTHFVPATLKEMHDEREKRKLKPPRGPPVATRHREMVWNYIRGSVVVLDSAISFYGACRLVSFSTLHPEQSNVLGSCRFCCEFVSHRAGLSVAQQRP
jgi:hypothetical protein